MPSTDLKSSEYSTRFSIMKGTEEILAGCIEEFSAQWDTRFELRPVECGVDGSEVKLIIWGATEGQVELKNIKLDASVAPATPEELEFDSNPVDIHITQHTSPNDLGETDWTIIIPDCLSSGETYSLTQVGDSLYFLEGVKFSIYKENPLNCADQGNS